MGRKRNETKKAMRAFRKIINKHQVDSILPLGWEQWRVGFAVCVLLLAACCFPLSAQAQISFDFKPGGAAKLLRARSALLNMYVDTLNEQKLVDAAIRGMIEDLDPHTQYSTAEEAKRMTEMFSGHFDGIGVQYRMLDDTLLVIKTVAGGPSEKAGLQPGDRIVRVNDSIIAGVKMKQEDINKRLRGKKGTSVRVAVKRSGVKKLLSFELKRKAIPTQSIHCAYMIRPTVGYIRLETFAMTSHEEFVKAVGQLRNEGMQTLILDLQNNTGGILDAAVRIMNEFLEKDELIVYGEGTNYKRRDYRADGRGTLKQLPVYVLINYESASASEIVAGALQDQDRGTIVGQRSFGKGCIQSPVMLDDGSMLRVTVAHFYSPSGRCIQKPFQRGHRKEYETEILAREKSGEFFSADSVHVNDSLRYETLKQHRTVFGGGGIVPDEFVPIDTTTVSRQFTRLLAAGIPQDVCLRFWDNHRTAYEQQFPTLSEYEQKFIVPDELIDEILRQGEKKDIRAKDETDAANCRLRLKKYLRMLMATDIFDTCEGIMIGNADNQVLQHTLKLIAEKQ